MALPSVLRSTKTWKMIPRTDFFRLRSRLSIFPLGLIKSNTTISDFRGWWAFVQDTLLHFVTSNRKQLSNLPLSPSF